MRVRKVVEGFGAASSTHCLPILLVGEFFMGC